MARLIGKHLGKHLPGKPKFVVANMEGASHRVAANHVYAAKPDGLTLALMNNGVPSYNLAGETAEDGTRFDVGKMGWIGSPSREVQVLVMHKRTGAVVGDMDSVLRKEWKIAHEGIGGAPHLTQVALELGLGFKLKPIFGYAGADRDLSVDRGETDGVIGVWDSVERERKSDLESGTLVPIVTIGGEQPDSPHLKGVPTAEELVDASDDDSKQALLDVEAQKLGWSRSLVAPPGMSTEMLETLRKAFDSTMEDPEFLSAAADLKITITATKGEVIQDRIAQYLKTDESVVKSILEAVEADRDK